jgi:molybdopterin molybdotransferase
MEKGFFRVVSVTDFLQLLRDFRPVQGEDRVGLEESDGRILAGNVFAPEDLPPFTRAGMDGYAVRAGDTFGAGESNPGYLSLAGSVEIGEVPGLELMPGQCAGIVTGAALPGGADAVVMVEYTQELGAGDIEIRRSVAPGDNLMLQGEDVRRDQPVLSAGTRLRPQETGLLAALGISWVSVFPEPVVALISTGDELVPPDRAPGPGQIRDVNTHSLASWIRRAGGKPVSYGIVPDDLAQVREALQQALEASDLVCISGGSSVGARDHTLQALQELPGGEILAHGVALSPGKPTILARVGDKPVLGLPGQVTSVQVVMYVLGSPLIRHLAGEADAFSRRRISRIPARMARNVASKPGREDYVRVRLEQQEEGDEPLASPLLGKAGLLRTLLQADGLVRIPAHSEGLLRDSPVTVWML